MNQETRIGYQQRMTTSKSHDSYRTIYHSVVTSFSYARTRSLVGNSLVPDQRRRGKIQTPSIFILSIISHLSPSLSSLLSTIVLPPSLVPIWLLSFPQFSVALSPLPVRSPPLRLFLKLTACEIALSLLSGFLLSNEKAIRSLRFDVVIVYLPILKILILSGSRKSSRMMKDRILGVSAAGFRCIVGLAKRHLEVGKAKYLFWLVSLYGWDTWPSRRVLRGLLSSSSYFENLSTDNWCHMSSMQWNDGPSARRRAINLGCNYSFVHHAFRCLTLL